MNLRGMVRDEADRLDLVQALQMNGTKVLMDIVKQLRDEAFREVINEGKMSEVLKDDFRCKLGRVELADEILSIQKDARNLIKE